MAETFFIGDLHFGHKSIIGFEPEHRPFANLEEMHEEMIKCWNSVVRKGDKVIVAGDFCFGEKWVPLAGRLNGLKYLIGGNHDNLKTATYLKFFHKVICCMEFDGNIITHIPVHPDQLCRYKANIHGHLHSKTVKFAYHGTLFDDTRYINVSCEQINLTPISYAEIKRRIDG